MQSFKTSLNRNEYLLHMRTDLPFIEQKILNETEQKCFEIANSQVIFKLHTFFIERNDELKF